MKKLSIIDKEKLEIEISNNDQGYLKPLLNCLVPVLTSKSLHENCMSKKCRCMQHYRNQWAGSVSLMPTAGPWPECTCVNTAECEHKNQLKTIIYWAEGNKEICLTICLDCEDKLPNHGMVNGINEHDHKPEEKCGACKNPPDDTFHTCLEDKPEKCEHPDHIICEKCPPPLPIPTKPTPVEECEHEMIAYRKETKTVIKMICDKCGKEEVGEDTVNNPNPVRNIMEEFDEKFGEVTMLVPGYAYRSKRANDEIKSFWRSYILYLLKRLEALPINECGKGINAQLDKLRKEITL